MGVRGKGVVEVGMWYAVLVDQMSFSVGRALHWCGYSRFIFLLGKTYDHYVRRY